VILLETLKEWKECQLQALDFAHVMSQVEGRVTMVLLPAMQNPSRRPDAPAGWRHG